MRTALSCLFCAFALANAAAWAQQQDRQVVGEKDLTAEEKRQIEALRANPPQWYAGAAFANSVPQGEFQDKLLRSGQGFTLFGAYALAPAPLAVGLNVDVLFYGGDKQTFAAGPFNRYRDTITSQNMVIPLSLFARLQPPWTGLLLPYLEGFAGGTFFSASADYRSNINSPQSQNKGGFAGHYGYGAGLLVKLGDFISLPNSYAIVYFDLRARLLKGGSTDYNTVTLDPAGYPQFATQRSATDLFLLYAGFTARF